MRLRRAALRLGITTGAITTVVCVVLCLTALPTEKRYLMPMALVCSLSLIGQHVMLIMTAVDRGSGQFSAYNARRVIAAAAFPALLLIAASIVQINLTSHLLAVCRRIAHLDDGLPGGSGIAITKRKRTAGSDATMGVPTLCNINDRDRPL